MGFKKVDYFLLLWILNFCAGEECPTDGTAFIFGKDVCSNPKAARRHVSPDLGYILVMLECRWFVEDILIIAG